MPDLTFATPGGSNTQLPGPCCCGKSKRQKFADKLKGRKLRYEQSRDSGGRFAAGDAKDKGKQKPAHKTKLDTRTAEQIRKAVAEDRRRHSRLKYSFCATGEGGGVDPTCGDGEQKAGGENKVNKVVGKSGKPLTVFHGSDQQFNEFKDGPTYFSPSPGYSYAWHSPHVVESEITMENPYYTEHLTDVEGVAYQEKWLAELKSKGYDGIIYSKKGDITKGPTGWGDDHPQFVVFSKSQIKPGKWYSNEDFRDGIQSGEIEIGEKQRHSRLSQFIQKLRYDQKHAPEGGSDAGGKHFEGGQFTPSDAADSGPDEEYEDEDDDAALINTAREAFTAYSKHFAELADAMSQPNALVDDVCEYSKGMENELADLCAHVKGEKPDYKLDFSRDGGKLRYAACSWITIGGKKTEDGRKGGAKICIGKGGSIEKGPAKFVGGSIKGGKLSVGAEHDTRGSRKEKADSRDRADYDRRKQAKQAGLDPADVAREVESLRESDKAAKEPLHSLYREAKKLLGVSSRNKAFATGGDVDTLQKQGYQFDDVAQTLAADPQYQGVIDQDDAAAFIFDLIHQGPPKLKTDDELWSEAIEAGREYVGSYKPSGFTRAADDPDRFGRGGGKRRYSFCATGEGGGVDPTCGKEDDGDRPESAKESRRVVRFEAGKSLSKDEKKTVLKSVRDVYKDAKLEKVEKGYDRNDELILGYPYSPDLFVLSDITGAKIRHYITLPDGKKAHPSELYPNVKQSDILRAMGESEAEQKSAEDRDNRREARYGETRQDANEKYKATGRSLPHSYFAESPDGRLVRVDGIDTEDIEYFENRGYRRISPPVPKDMDPEKAARQVRAAINSGRSVPDEVLKDYPELKPKSKFSRFITKLRYAKKSSEGGQWVTMGGTHDPQTGEKHVGGSRVKIDGKGRIVSHQSTKLHGKTIGEIDKDVAGTAEDERKLPGPKAESSQQPSGQSVSAHVAKLNSLYNSAHREDVSYGQLEAAANEVGKLSPADALAVAQGFNMVIPKGTSRAGVVREIARKLTEQKQSAVRISAIGPPSPKQELFAGASEKAKVQFPAPGKPSKREWHEMTLAEANDYSNQQAAANHAESIATYKDELARLESGGNPKLGEMPFWRDKGKRAAQLKQMIAAPLKKVDPQSVKWAHESGVEARLKAGGNVSPDVLADYPELAAKHGKEVKPFSLSGQPPRPEMKIDSDPTKQPKLFAGTDWKPGQAELFDPDKVPGPKAEQPAATQQVPTAETVFSPDVLGELKMYADPTGQRGPNAIHNMADVYRRVKELSGQPNLTMDQFHAALKDADRKGLLETHIANERHHLSPAEQAASFRDANGMTMAYVVFPEKRRK